MINDFFASTLLFGLVFTIFTFWFFKWLGDKLRSPLINPMLFSMAVMIALMKLGHITFDTYYASARILDYLLGPATVALAIPLYRKLAVLKENALAILVGTFTGVFSSLLIVTGVCLLLGSSDSVFLGILPKSVTTAIAREIAAELGGSVPLCVICVCITGNTGAILVKFLPKVFGIKDDLSLGVAIGSNSHGMGSSAAFEHSQLAGAISSLSMVVACIMMVILAPLVAGLLW